MNGLSRFCYLVEWYDIVQSQADFLQKCKSSLHEQTLLSENLFGGYASPRKHIVFSRLALNDLFLPRCVSEAAVQYDWDIHPIRNCLFIRFPVTLIKPEKTLKVPEVKKFYKHFGSRAVVEFRINTGFTASCFFGTLLVAFAQIKDSYKSVRCSATIVSSVLSLSQSTPNTFLPFIYIGNLNRRPFNILPSFCSSS